jgi:hypothetical protein
MLRRGTATRSSAASRSAETFHDEQSDVGGSLPPLEQRGLTFLCTSTIRLAFIAVKARAERISKMFLFSICSRSKAVLSSEAKQAVVAELKRIRGELNLSDDQKTRLQTALENARKKIDEFRKANPNMKQDEVIAKLRSVRDGARERLVQFLTPDQLAKWDAENERFRAHLGEPCFPHPIVAFGPGIVEPARGLDQHVEAH